MTHGRPPHADIPDTGLMLLARDGDTCAFEALYGRYHRKVLDFFYGLGRDAHQAEDLCQETFLRIWRLRARYTDSGAFPGYLFGFARHIWQERCRSLGRTRRLGARIDIDDAADWTPCPATRTPREEAHLAEAREHIFAVLDTLPEEQRVAFLLRTVQGLPLDTIAEVLECPVNTVRSRKLLATRKLREALRGLFAL
jgi:RNA polymerase sigma-70 factor, ECF subfamily